MLGIKLKSAFFTNSAQRKTRAARHRQQPRCQSDHHPLLVDDGIPIFMSTTSEWLNCSASQGDPKTPAVNKVPDSSRCPIGVLSQQRKLIGGSPWSWPYACLAGAAAQLRPYGPDFDKSQAISTIVIAKPMLAPATSQLFKPVCGRRSGKRVAISNLSIAVGLSDASGVWQNHKIPRINR